MSTLEEKLSTAKIGHPQEIIHLDERSQHQITVATLAEQARQEILLISRTLDPLVYGTPQFLDRVTPFIRSKRATMRMLVHDTYNIVKHTHRLGELAASISSKVAIRKIGSRQNDYNEAWMLVDGVAFLHMPQAEKYQASLDFYSARRGQELTAVFDDLWNNGEQIPDLRILKI